MEELELNSIIGEQSNTPLFTEDNTENKTVDTAKPFVCDVCQKSFSTQLALTGHKRSHGIGVTKKEKADKVNDISVPSEETYLGTLLKAFSVPNAPGILLAMQNDGSNLHRFKDMLRAVALPAPKIEVLVNLYAEHLGIKPDTKESQSAESKPSPIRETINMMQDTIQLQALQTMSGHRNNGENTEVASLKAQIQEMKDLLIRQKSEQELALLKKDLEESKKENDNQMGSLAGMMKDFITAQRHESEMLRKDMLHERQIEELKESIQKSQSVTNTFELADKAIRTTAETLQSAGGALAGLSKRQLEIEESLARGNILSQLLAQGVPYHEAVNQISGMMPIRPRINAEQEMADLEKLNKIVDTYTPTIPPTKPHPMPKPPEPVQFVEQIPEKVKFSDASSE